MDININKFLDYLKFERNFSNNTIIGYKNHLNLFNNYLKKVKINNINNIDYNIVRSYINFLYDSKYNSKSICNHLSSLRSFFKYLTNEELIKTNPMLLI